eukprot:CAMPEP_0185843914 /NCGR_PEP_ID=MMETSP1354-20130828/276_1 /TAXON_ID=708628 /ORGANISM="Erythrolobus madagascarensis, Strain CCMP3276" /LENGTH=193 /DNA_ID=CAMNT_0028543503 /DNA_START=348 /DNA_END=928 /DNA_ORIENTATION=+
MSSVKLNETRNKIQAERLSKSDAVFEALGSVDLASAHIGVAREHCRELLEKHPNALEIHRVVTHLTTIQSTLLDVGASIATARTHPRASAVAQQLNAHENISALERWIDEMEHRLPRLTKFVLPGAGLASSHLHVARASVRAAERRVCALLDHNTHAVDPDNVRYLNRLSDYLFTSARTAAARARDGDEFRTD